MMLISAEITFVLSTLSHKPDSQFLCDFCDARDTVLLDDSDSGETCPLQGAIRCSHIPVVTLGQREEKDWPVSEKLPKFLGNSPMLPCDGQSKSSNSCMKIFRNPVM